jgi:hypothetical protein
VRRLRLQDFETGSPAPSIPSRAPSAHDGCPRWHVYADQPVTTHSDPACFGRGARPAAMHRSGMDAGTRCPSSRQTAASHADLLPWRDGTAVAAAGGASLDAADILLVGGAYRPCGASRAVDRLGPRLVEFERKCGPQRGPAIQVLEAEQCRFGVASWARRSSQGSHICLHAWRRSACGITVP